jgi:hypothetical protein
MRTEHWRNDTVTERPRYCEKNLSQCHSVHYARNYEWPAIKPGPPRRQTGAYFPPPEKMASYTKATERKLADVSPPGLSEAVMLPLLRTFLYSPTVALPFCSQECWY